MTRLPLPSSDLPPGLEISPVRALAAPRPRIRSVIFTAAMAGACSLGLIRPARALVGLAGDSTREHPKRWATIDLVDITAPQGDTPPRAEDPGDGSRKNDAAEGPSSARDHALDALAQAVLEPLGQVPEEALADLDLGKPLDLPRDATPRALPAVANPIYMAGGLGTGAGRNPGPGGSGVGVAGGTGASGRFRGQGGPGGAPEFGLEEIDFVNIHAPNYPLKAILQRIQGDVRVRICFTEGGRHLGHEYLSAGLEVFRDAIEDVLPSWRIQPMKIDGQPTKACVTFIFRFTLLNGGTGKGLPPATGAVRVGALHRRKRSPDSARPGILQT